MGGSIRVIIREEDGKVHKMIRWTNHLPYFVKNKKFFDCDKEYIKEYINRNDSYRVDDNIMAPECYGITVFDFMKKKILNMQGYCGYSEIDNSELYISRDDNSRFQNRDVYFDSYTASKELLNCGYLKFQELSYNKNDYSNTNEIHDIEPITIDEFIDGRFEKGILNSIKNMFGEKVKGDIVSRVILSIDYDKIGWKLIDDRSEDVDMLFKIYETMYEDGFNFSNDDNEVWESEMREKEECWDVNKNEFPYPNGTFLNYKRTKQIDDIL